MLNVTVSYVAFVFHVVSCLASHCNVHNRATTALGA